MIAFNLILNYSLCSIKLVRFVQVNFAGTSNSEDPGAIFLEDEVMEASQENEASSSSAAVTPAPGCTAKGPLRKRVGFLSSYLFIVLHKAHLYN